MIQWSYSNRMTTWKSYLAEGDFVKVAELGDMLRLRWRPLTGGDMTGCCCWEAMIRSCCLSLSLSIPSPSARGSPAIMEAEISKNRARLMFSTCIRIYTFMSVELLCLIDTKVTLLSPESNAWVQSDNFSSNAYHRHASYVHSRHLESHSSNRKPTTGSVATGTYVYLLLKCRLNCSICMWHHCSAICGRFPLMLKHYKEGRSAIMTKMWSIKSN